MTREIKFTCPLVNGVHARPASRLEEVAACFGAEILLTNSRTGRTANAKSVLSIVGADIRYRDLCRFTVTGADEADAAAAINRFLQEDLPVCDEVEAGAGATAGETVWLSPVLEQSGAVIRRGTPVVPGMGQGRLVWASGLRVMDSIGKVVGIDPVEEMHKLDSGLTGLLANYEEQLARHAAGVERDMLKAHRSIARDPEFRARLHEQLKSPDASAAAAIAQTEAFFTAMLAQSESALLRERALDVQDVCSQLLLRIYGQAAIAEVQLESDSILVAETLTPGQLLGLDRRRLKGLVLSNAGTTSHTVILARSFGVPTLTAVPDLVSSRLAGQQAVVDGDAGLLVTEITDQARRYYAMEARRLQGRAERQRRFLTIGGATADGHPVAIACNIATGAETAAAFDCGADEIGLFRTEMLFMDRPQPPGEEEQYRAYQEAVVSAAGRPVVVRTFDVGGDKQLGYLNLPPEDNPFLGYRAVRMYPEFENLFRTQVRAMLRASAEGNLHCMVPMITCIEEVRWVKQVIASEQSRCEAEGLPFNPDMPIGAMIEVPATAFLLPELCQELDFFSVGSNDLLQYFTAADRGNVRLTRLQSRLQPAFLRLLKRICDDVSAAGKPVALCGEMGGQLICLPLLVALGFHEISVVPCLATAIKAELATWSLPECRELLKRALACGTEVEVRQMLERDAACAHKKLPVVDYDLVEVQSQSLTKSEAIKEAVDRLYVLGRTEQPRQLEQAVWQREKDYPTGFGNGFAIPHCKTNAVSATSICLIKLKQPVEWGSIDDQPVDFLILLAVREAEQPDGHMKILSRLARKLIHDDFRDALRAEHDPAALCALLQGCLNS